MRNKLLIKLMNHLNPINSLSRIRNSRCPEPSELFIVSKITKNLKIQTDSAMANRLLVKAYG